MKLKIFRCKLTNAALMANNGCRTLTFLDLEEGNDGRDDHECQLIGAMEIGDEWQLAISHMGEPMFVHYLSEAPILVGGEFGVDIKDLPRQFPGFKFTYSTGDATMLQEMPEWQELQSSFLELEGA